MSAIEDMVSVLRNRCGFEPAEMSHSKDLRILARIANLDNWRVILHRIKVAELKNTWTLDISQLYFLKTKNERAPIVKGWRLILRADNPEEACKQIAAAAQSAPAARVMIDEIPLPGGGAHRNYTGAGKGAAALSGSGSSGPALHFLPHVGSR